MNQISLFEFSKPKYKITKPIRLIELFGGIGSQAKALKNLGANFEHYKLVEFDQHAVDSYNAVHGTNFVTQDITQTHSKDLAITDRESYTYILTYSFPCQDLSLAGKGRGMEKGTGTRSGLLWEVERILDECDGELPQILLMENVPQVHSLSKNENGHSNLDDFTEWQRKLTSLGYSNWFQDLNAKDYGIPQNRNRCFMVSILGDYYYSFPRKQKLEKRLIDFLEKNVDEKYYLSEKTIEYFINHTEYFKKNGGGFCFKPIDPLRERERVARTLTTNSLRMDNTFIKDVPNEDGGGLPILNNTKQGYLMAQVGDGVDISGRMKDHRGTVQKGMCQTIKTSIDIGVVVNE